jgi:5'-nucleotidase/UDP-sugar diphosphatase
MLSKMAGAAGLIGLAVAAAGADTTFRLVHMNDFHGRIRGVDFNQGNCKDGQACDGGWVRIFSAAKRMVEEAGSVPVIFVDDGDQFMGSLWSSYYKGEEVRRFLDLLCAKKQDGGAGFAACVATLGNHEFDYSNAKLVDYLKDLRNVTMVSSNIEDDCTSPEENIGKYLRKTHVVTLPGGVQVGFVGYTTTETPAQSSVSSCTRFLKEEEALPLAIKKLTDDGVKIVIAAGHSGYGRDKAIARDVPGLDLIVSGHSHTFLWTDESTKPRLTGAGTSSPYQKQDGDYPTLVPNANSVSVPIVQAFWAGRYLGNIEVTFNEAGVLRSQRPLQVLVGGNSSVPEHFYGNDTNALALLNEMKGPIDAIGRAPVGTVNGLLDGERNEVRSRETNLGNLVCDALMTQANSKPATSVSLCLANGGGIRASMGSAGVTRAVTFDDVNLVLPFGNTLSIVDITGLMVWNMVEHGTARVESKQGEFGHFGKGFRMWYSQRRKPACGGFQTGNVVFNKTCTSDNTDFNRVSRIELNGVPVPKDASKTYRMATVDFLARGQDGYIMLRNASKTTETGIANDFILQQHMTKLNLTSNGNIAYEEDCRIVLEEAPSKACVKLGITLAPTAAPTAPTTAAPTTAAPTAAPTAPTTAAPITRAPSVRQTVLVTTSDAQAATPAVIISAAALALAALL